MWIEFLENMSAILSFFPGMYDGENFFFKNQRLIFAPLRKTVIFVLKKR